MGYIVLGGLGVIGVVVGVVLGITGNAVGGWIVGSVGALLSAASLIGIGLDRRRPSLRLEDVQAAQRLAEREAERRQREAEDAERREVDELRLARLRDIDRIRRAVLAELRKLQPGVSLKFQWGRTAETLEWHEYALFEDRGLFNVLFQHNGVQGKYHWPEGGIPIPADAEGGTSSPERPDDVEGAWALLQPERYLVCTNLPPDDQLELEEPGYTRHGRPRPAD